MSLVDSDPWPPAEQNTKYPVTFLAPNVGPGAPNQNSDRTVNNKVKFSKIIKSIENGTLIWKIFMIQPKSPKVGKTAKYPQWALQPARRWTSTQERAKSRSNANLLRAQITSRSNAHGRDRHAGQLGAETTSETTSEITLNVQGSRPNHIWMLICSESDSLHIQVCKDQFECWRSGTTLPLNRVRMQICSESDLLCIRTRWASPLNAILPRSQITLHSNALGFASECDSPQEPNHFAFKRVGIHVWIASECWSPQGSNLPHNPMCSVFHSHSWWSTDKRLQPTAADFLFTLTHLRYGVNYFYLFQLHCVMYVYCCLNHHS